MMDKLILQCGRYIPPTQTDDAGRLRRLESYVVTLSSEVEALFEACERLRREITRRMTEPGEGIVALSAPKVPAAESEVALAEGADAPPTDAVSDATEEA